VKHPVKLGLELIAHQPVQMKLGTFFETWIATASGSARRSLGRDEYHLRLTVSPGGRLAATGRTHICQVDLEAAGLGSNGARQALLAPVARTEGSPILWGVRTNRFLRAEDLRQFTRARLVQEGGRVTEFDLTDGGISVQTLSAGRYLIDVTPLLTD